MQHCLTCRPHPLTQPLSRPNPGQQNCENCSHVGTGPRVYQGGACGEGLGCVASVGLTGTRYAAGKWRRSHPDSLGCPRTWSCPPSCRVGASPPTHTPARACGLSWAAPRAGAPPGPWICCLDSHPTLGTGPCVHCGLPLCNPEGRRVTQPCSHSRGYLAQPPTRLTFMPCPCCPHCAVREVGGPRK